VLVGRDSERAAVREVLTAARAGEGGSVGFTGPPGIGKTSMLDYCRSIAEGFLVVEAAGLWTSSPNPFAAVRALTSQLAPEAARRSVPVAAGDPEPFLPGADGTYGSDPLLFAARFVSLVHDAAAVSPVLILVDDAQWLDGPSFGSLQFLVPRVSGESAALLVTARDPSRLPYGLTHRMELAPLNEAQSEQMIAMSPRYTDPLRRATIVDTAAGNPLALFELSARPAVAGEVLTPFHLQSLYEQELSRLPTELRVTLATIVLQGREGGADVARALVRLGVGAEPLQELRAAGWVTDGTRGPRPRHPVVAAAVLAATPPEELVASHLALAEVIGHLDPLRALLHRASAATGPTPDLAAELAEQAGRANRAGRQEEAIEAYQHAARLGPAGAAEWMTMAAELAAAPGPVGRAQALVDLARRVVGAADPVERAAMQARLAVCTAQAELRLGHRDSAIAILLVTLPQLESERRSEVAETVIRTVGLQDPATAAAVAPYLDHDRSPLVHRLVTASALGEVGNAPESSSQQVRDAVQHLPPDAEALAVDLLAGVCLEWGWMGRARSLMLPVESGARASGQTLDLAESLLMIAFIDHELGRWNTSTARLSELLGLMDPLAAPGLVSEALLLQSEIDAARGVEGPCRAACRRARRLAELADDVRLEVLVDKREALLEIGLGDLAAAGRRLEHAADSARRADVWDPYSSPLPDLVEVYLRTDRAPEARRIAAEFVDQIGPDPPPLARARAARLRGMTAEHGTYDEHFRESIAIDHEVGAPFLAARTQLLYGERLRRDRRRVDGRAEIERALDTFRRLEATPWERRAATELVAAGGTAGLSVGPSLSELLTPQELQVAVLVADGRRNREIAGALFISDRTVEHHLSRAYRKLGLSSRTQLAARVRG
jgi:DNA-binding CsgD family transcriptional regulator